MSTKTYNANIVQAVKGFMDNGWNYDFDENEGVFLFSVSVPNKMKAVAYTIYVKEEGFLTRAAAPLGADMNDLDMVHRLVEFISRINDGMLRGSFSLDWNDGEISFQFYTDCEGIDQPSHGMVENALFFPGAMFDKYGNAMIEVLFHEDVDVKETAAEARKKSRYKKEEDVMCDFDVDGLMDELEAYLRRAEGREEDEKSDNGAGPQ